MNRVNATMEGKWSGIIVEGRAGFLLGNRYDNELDTLELEVVARLEEDLSIGLERPNLDRCNMQHGHLPEKSMIVLHLGVEKSNIYT